MFRLDYQRLLIVGLIVLDVFLILNLVHVKNSKVLGASTIKKKTVTLTVKKIASPTPTKVKTTVAAFAAASSITKVPTPTKIPAPTAVISTSTPTSAPTAVPVSAGSGDLLTQVNNFRAGKGLAPLTARSEACFFANIRAQEIATNFSHDGFNSRVSANTLPYPSWTSVAENIAMNPNPNAVVQAWIDSPGHNVNMSKDVPYGCVVGSGNFYVFEAWKP